MNSRRRGALKVALGLAALVIAVPSAPSAAQTTSPRTELTLLSQTPWVTAGGDFRMRLGSPPLTDEQLRDLELSIAVHPAVVTRTAFQRTLTQPPASSPLALVTNAIASVARDDTGAFEVVLGVQDAAAPRDASRVLLRNPGVYPVVAELRPPGGGVVRARLTTHLLYVPEPPEGPRLGVTMVLPLSRPPALRPDGAVRFGDNAAASFTGLADALTGVGPWVLFDPNPETLAALGRSESEADRAALETLRAASAGRPTVTDQPFVPVARAAYTGPDGLATLRTLDERGQEIVETTLHAADPSGVSVLRAGIDEAHLPTTAKFVVVPEDLLQPVEQRVTLANSVALRRGSGRSSGTLPAVVADAALGAHFGSDRPAVLGAHQLLADLATIYFDSPGRQRSVVVLPPRSAVIRAAQVAPVLAGITSSSILAPAAIDEQFAPSATRPPLRLLAPPGPVARPSDLAPVRADVASLASSFGDDLERAATFTDRVLIAHSSDLRGRARAAYIDGLEAAVEAERRQFRLPRRAAARLTARTGRIPITVNSHAEYPARVLLEVASDKLQFPGGATRTLVLTRRNTTTQVSVTTQGSGTFPLRVVLKTPDGRLVLAESRFTVQSTAVSGVGVALSAGALLVLGGWWVRHNRRYRPRARRRSAAAARK